jgi:hypothetical protein
LNLQYRPFCAIFSLMEDSARLKLIVLGLVLAAIAGAYLFFSGRVASNKTANATPKPSASSVAVAQDPGTPMVVPNSPLQSDVPGQQIQPLPQTGLSGGQPPVQGLPNTGLPLDLAGSIGAAAVVVGYALRKYPK